MYHLSGVLLYLWPENHSHMVHIHVIDFKDLVKNSVRNSKHQLKNKE
jgi:hypothetical protein